MKFVIETARDVHMVRNEAELALEHAALIRRKRQRGIRVHVHDSFDPKVARIDHGRWLIDCDCGAGNACDPEMKKAFCAACGAVHPNVVFPDDRENVEFILLARRRSENRNFDPTKERFLDLAKENAEHGVRW